MGGGRPENVGFQAENHTGKSSQPGKATVAAAHGTRAERLSSKALKITLKILSLF